MLGYNQESSSCKKTRREAWYYLKYYKYNKESLFVYFENRSFKTKKINFEFPTK